MVITKGILGVTYHGLLSHTNFVTILLICSDFVCLTMTNLNQARIKMR